MPDVISIIQWILFASACGAGNDLLDYVPTDAYWRGKSVEITAANMLREAQPAAPADVAALIKDFTSDDPRRSADARQQLRQVGPAALPALTAAQNESVEHAASLGALIIEIRLTPKANDVRRLMAIRALGELRANDAVAPLHGLTNDADYFVADYAKTAIASIEGRAAERARAPWTDRDVWLLPSRLRAVAGYAPRPPPPLSIDAALHRLQPPPNLKPNEIGDGLLRRLLPIAEAVGNVRFDGVTCGISGDIGERSGFVVAILRGRYDRQALAGFLALQKMPAMSIDNSVVFRPDQESALFLPSDDRIVLLSSPQGRELPLEETAGGIRTMSGRLREDAEMTKLITSIGTTEPLWAAVKVTDAYRRVPLLGGMDTVTLVGRATAPETLTVTLKADARDAADAKSAMHGATALAASLGTEVRGSLSKASDLPAPVAHAIQALVDNIRVTSEGKTVTLSATLTAPRQALLDRLLAVYGALLTNVPEQ